MSEQGLFRNVAEAALWTALNHHGTMSERKVAETIIKVADRFPDVIDDEIRRCQQRIRMLKGYLEK